MSQAAFLRSAHPLIYFPVQPRAMIRRVLGTSLERYTFGIAACGGIVGLADSTLFRTPSLDGSPVRSVALLLMLGTVAGVVSLFCLAAVCGTVGRWLRGVATQRELRTAMGWSNLPNAAALPFAVLLFGLVRGEPRIAGVLTLLIFLNGVAVTWSLVLMCHAIAEVQGYRSAWRGLTNLWMAILLTAVPALAIDWILRST